MNLTNLSGIRPINCNVLVLPDAAEEKKGSLYLPQTVQEKDQHAQTSGCVVAMAPDAFMDVDGQPSVDVKPGDRVSFARYGGKPIIGSDEKTYWMLKDVDVTGVWA